MHTGVSTIGLENKKVLGKEAALKKAGAAFLKQKKKAEKLKPYLFLAPAILMILFWHYKPLLETIQYSLYKWSMVPGTVPEYVGLQNFQKLLTNKDFVPALKNTLFYVLGMLPFSIILPIFIATATQDLNNAAKRIYRTLFFIPMIMAPVAVSVIFQWLLHPSNGLINHLLQVFGITTENIAFFSNQKYAMPMIILISGWK